jgi:hypothetical protein
MKKTALTIAVLAVLVISFPPWHGVFTNLHTGVEKIEPEGFAPIWAPPVVEYGRRPRIDSTQLMIELCGASILGFVLAQIPWSRKLG